MGLRARKEKGGESGIGGTDVEYYVVCDFCGEEGSARDPITIESDIPWDEDVNPDQDNVFFRHKRCRQIGFEELRFGHWGWSDFNKIVVVCGMQPGEPTQLQESRTRRNEIADGVRNKCIYPGHQHIEPGAAVIGVGDFMMDRFNVIVDRVVHASLRVLSDAELHGTGHENVQSLRNECQEMWPELSYDDPCTMVEIRVTDKS